MKPMKVDAAPGQDIFVPSPAWPGDMSIKAATSPKAASDRPFPIDVEDAAQAFARVIVGPSCPCGSCKRTQKEQDISFRLREMGDIELDILLSTQARLLMGQGQYGKFAEIDPRDLPKEALEEVQDALVYVAKRLGELGR